MPVLIWKAVSTYIKNCCFRSKQALSPCDKGRHIVALSNCKQILIFRSGFPVLPRKISEYLRADSPSGANSRIIRGWYKTLSVRYLYLTTIFSCRNKHHFSMRYCPYQGLKCLISRHDIDKIKPSKGHYQNAGWFVPEYDIGYIKMLFGQKEPLLYEIWHPLTPIFRICFVKKKSRKIVSWLPEFSWNTPLSDVRRNMTENNIHWTSIKSLLWWVCKQNKTSAHKNIWTEYINKNSNPRSSYLNTKNGDCCHFIVIYLQLCHYSIYNRQHNNGTVTMLYGESLC